MHEMPEDDLERQADEDQESEQKYKHFFYDKNQFKLFNMLPLTIKQRTAFFTDLQHERQKQKLEFPERRFIRREVEQLVKNEWIMHKRDVVGEIAKKGSDIAAYTLEPIE